MDQAEKLARVAQLGQRRQIEGLVLSGSCVQITALAPFHFRHSDIAMWNGALHRFPDEKWAEM